MALKKLKPTSPGTRFQLRPTAPRLPTWVRREIPPSCVHKSTGGRNNVGRPRHAAKGSDPQHNYRMMTSAHRQGKESSTSVIIAS